METKLSIEEYNDFSEKLVFKYENEWVEENQKTLPNGLVLAGTPENIETLEEILEQMEEDLRVTIDPSIVPVLAMGEMPYDAPGGYCIKTKAIKLHPVTSGRDREYSRELILLHEYAHAMDFHVDLYKEFEEEYVEMLDEVGYNYHKSEDHSWKIGVEPGLSGNFMMDMRDFSSNFANHQKVVGMGYCGLRCVINIREFVAMAFMHWFITLDDNKEGFNGKVDDLLEKYFFVQTVEA